MARKVFIVLLIGVLCLVDEVSTEKSSQVLTKGPDNSAVVNGGSVVLGCTSDTTLISWFFQPHGSQEVDGIYDGQKLNPLFEGIYSIDVRPGGHCDVIVLNATREETGIYRCKEATGFERQETAALVILDSAPVCTVNVSAASVSEGDVVLMSCHVSYTSNLSPALMTWTDPQGSTVTATEDRRDGYLESNITVTAALPSVGEYKCKTHFDVPDSGLTVPSAKNAPAYEHTFNSNVLAVNYCPNSVQITVPPGEPRVGDAISCSSNGSPSPTYTWTHIQTGQQTSGSTLTMNRVGKNKYTCTATVQIPGQLACTASTSTAISVTASSCLEMKQANNMTASGRYTLTLSNGKKFEVYCEMGLNGGGYTFLSPQSLLDLTDDDVQSIYTDHTNFLMRLRKFDDLQTYSVIRQLNMYRHIPIKLGLGNHNGYYGTVGEGSTYLGEPYLYFGFLSIDMLTNSSITTYGFNINNLDVSGSKSIANHIALFPGFLERGFYNTGGGVFTGCTTMLSTQQLTIPSSRAMPEEYFMSLEVRFESETNALYCLTSSNSDTIAALQVRNAAIGFR